MSSASTWDEIKPLIEMCKAGRLFEVQDWIASGKPVDPPALPKKGGKKSPLRIAIDSGFHSLVQVLLQGGASTSGRGYSPMEHCLSERRLDLVKLLVDHGISVRSVDMTHVFDTWGPNIIAFFIENGADAETGNPLAAALISRIRTALNIFKQYKTRFPSFQEQANIALRYHCREGDLKWVSLMLWAGADPLAKGPDDSDEESNPEEDLNALEMAALYGRHEIFKLKKIRDVLDPKQPALRNLLSSACAGDDAGFLEALLKNGFDPKGQEDGGSELIQSCLRRLAWAYEPGWWHERATDNIDGSRSRERMKMVHLLARAGAKWSPADKYSINDVRRTLLKMTPDYTTEFVWIMSKYNACKRTDLEALLKPTKIRALTSPHQKRISELLAGMPK